MLKRILTGKNEKLEEKYSGSDLETQIKAQFLFKLYSVGALISIAACCLFLITAPFQDNNIYILRAFLTTLISLSIGLFLLWKGRYQLSVLLFILLILLTNFARNVFPEFFAISPLSITDSSSRLMIILLFAIVFSKNRRFIFLTYFI